MNDRDHDTNHDCYLIMPPICSLSSSRTILLLAYIYKLVLCYGKKGTVFREESIIIQQRKQKTGVLLPSEHTSHTLFYFIIFFNFYSEE